jgi:hypothetical protein
MGSTDLSKPIRGADPDQLDQQSGDTSEEPLDTRTWPSAQSATKVRSWTSLVLTLVGVACVAVGVGRSDPARVDGLGILTAVSYWYVAGVTILIVAIGWSLAVHWRPTTTWFQLLVLTVCLHGLPGLIQSQPRFPVAWLHTGFAEYNAATNDLLPGLDARFSWPSFFTGSAALQRIAGTNDLDWVLRFAPVVFNLAMAAGVASLAMALGTSARRSAAAALMYVLSNWIGQDYFAPQATGALLVLIIVTIVLAKFSDSRGLPGPVQRLLGPFTVPGTTIQGREARLWYSITLLLSAALIASHQLSPVMLISMLLGLTIARRIRTDALWWIVSLGFLLWLSHAAEAYWVGHLDVLTGTAGDVGSILSSSVTERATGTDSRILGVRARILVAVVTWSAGGVALLIARARCRLDPALAALLLAPFIALLIQPYGGEILLRVALFTLPAATIAIAQVLPAPVRKPLTWARIGTGGLIVGVMIPAYLVVFLVARFGNESFEQVTANDAAIVEELHRVVPDGAIVYYLNSGAVVHSDRVGDVRFRGLGPIPDVGDLRRLRSEADASPVYLLFTEAQQNWGREVSGLDPDWMTEFVAGLARYDWLTTVDRRGDASLVRVGANS